MTEIDKTGNRRTNETTSNETTQTDATEESSEASDAPETGSVAGTARSLGEAAVDAASEANRRFSEAIGADESPTAGAAAGAAEGAESTTTAHELQATQKARRHNVEERKEQLGEALSEHTDNIRNDEDAAKQDWRGHFGPGSVYTDKNPSQWKDHYDTVNPAADRRENKKAAALVDADGHALSDADLDEVVAKHREELEKEGAFEGFAGHQVDQWAEGVKRHLAGERAEMKLAGFQPDSAGDLPVPEEVDDIGEREQLDGAEAEQLTKRLDEWESSQLAELEETARQAGADRSDGSQYERMTEDIQRARDTYEAIMTGNAEGENVGFPETVQASQEGGTLRPREAYRNHLQENPGDIVGAYQKVQERMDYSLRQNFIENAQF